MTEGYDIIGDVHGHAELLCRLLTKLHYSQRQGVWSHPNGRVAVFVGDLIDRGPSQLETVRIVRSMVEKGTALCCLGNHEFNALSCALGLRPLLPTDPHATFLAEVPKGSAQYKDCMYWFLTLPVWLDLGGAIVVHACWDPPSVEQLRKAGVKEDHTLDTELYHFAAMGKHAPEGTPESLAYHALDTLLKGREVSLPRPWVFIDNDGRERTRMRIRWWDSAAKTYAALALQPGVETIPDIPLQSPVRTTPPSCPLFVGHYWLTQARGLLPLSPLLACVDYSAGHGGPLVAYRWNRGDATMRSDRFVAADPIS